MELSSASILPEYPTTSAASMAASLRTVRSTALPFATARLHCLPDPTPIPVSCSAASALRLNLGRNCALFVCFEKGRVVVAAGLEQNARSRSRMAASESICPIRHAVMNDGYLRI